MKYIRILFFILIFACGSTEETINEETSFDGGINQARKDLQADSIRGWITSIVDISGASNQGPFYFQDDISAIEIWFPAGNQSFTDSVKRGNRLTLIGDIVIDARGVIQIHPNQFFVRDDREIPPGATALALDTVASLRYQSALARLIGVESIVPNELLWQGNKTYQVSDGVSTANLYIDPDTEIPGNFIGSFPKNITALITRDSAGNPIFVPRDMDDFFLTGFGFIYGPIISDTTNSSVVVNFVSSIPSDIEIHYGIHLGGPNPNFTQTIIQSSGATTYSVLISGLQTATTYDLKVKIIDHDDSAISVESIPIEFTTI